MQKRSFSVKKDYSRDVLIKDFGSSVLQDRYLLKGEKYQDIFARSAICYADDEEHAQRLYDYISLLFFLPSTPILSNAGLDRGLPISCFLNCVNDSLDSIVDIWVENVWLASNGGGIGTYWGFVRSIGEKIGSNGSSSGVIPFIRVMDSLALAISQGSLRRGSAAVYIDIHHPEIEEFLEIRKPSGDFNRKSLNLHHGIIIDDNFMNAITYDKDYDLISPCDGSIIRTVHARSLWQKILEIRLQTGEPYIVFLDHVNNARPEAYKKLNLRISQSNLCSEITLHSGLDHKGKKRTAVCCLASLNLECFDVWSKNDLFIQDIMRFLDNVLSDFISSAPKTMQDAIYSASRERSIGIGVMGWHSFLQSKNIPFESLEAQVWNNKIFAHIKSKADVADVLLAEERGACPDCIDAGEKRRFVCKTAIAPTASISIICGGVSPGIDPILANIYTHKTLSGSFIVKNKHLVALLEKRGRNTNDVWNAILQNDGSVAKLNFLTDEEKAVFKTAFEVNPQWILQHACHRQKYICQSQSLNIFLDSNVSKKELHKVHWLAWKMNIKSLYYCRSKSLQRTSFAGAKDSYDECLSCQ